MVAGSLRCAGKAKATSRCPRGPENTPRGQGIPNLTDMCDTEAAHNWQPPGAPSPDRKARNYQAPAVRRRRATRCARHAPRNNDGPMASPRHATPGNKRRPTQGEGNAKWRPPAPLEWPRAYPWPAKLQDRGGGGGIKSLIDNVVLFINAGANEKPCSLSGLGPANCDKAGAATSCARFAHALGRCLANRFEEGAATDLKLKASGRKCNLCKVWHPVPRSTFDIRHTHTHTHTRLPRWR